MLGSRLLCLLVCAWLTAAAPRGAYCRVAQLTQYGLAMLHSRVADGTLCVFFRNNHFCTAYKHRGGFYLLVTDEGYREQAQLVWEALSHVRAALLETACLAWCHISDTACLACAGWR